MDRRGEVQRFSRRRDLPGTAYPCPVFVTQCKIGWRRLIFYQVGSKLDKVAAGGRAVSFEEGKAFAESQGAGFCEVSSKTRENVRKPFVEVVDQIVQRPQLLAAATPASSSTGLNLGQLGSNYSSACPC